MNTDRSTASLSRDHGGLPLKDAASPRRRRIHSMLLMLVLVAVLPLTAILAYNTYSDTAEELARQRSTTLALAKANAGEVNRLLGQVDRLLATLIQSAQVRSLDPGHCDHRLSEYQRIYPNIANITTMSRDGVIVCSALDSEDGEYRESKPVRQITSGNAAWFAQAIAAQGLRVGGPTIGPVSGLPVSNITVPLRDASLHTKGLLVVSLNLATYDPNITLTSLPAGTRTGIVRSDGHLIWSSAGTLVANAGEAAHLPPLLEILGIGEGSRALNAPDGTQSLYAVSPVGIGELYAFVGLPDEGLLGEETHRAMRNVAFGIEALLVAAGLSTLIARRISRPIEALAEVARRLQGGEKSQRACIDGSSETAFLAASFNSLVDSWQRAEQRVEESLRRVEDLYQNAPCGYHSIDSEGTFIGINDTELRWLGYKREEVVGRMGIRDILSPGGRVRFERELPDLRLTGVIRDLSTEYVCRDGSLLPVLITASAVTDASGRFVMSRSIVYDMRERRKYEQNRDENARLIRELSRHLISVQEEERRRLSSELHDRVSANLAALVTNLKAIEKGLSATDSAELADVLADSRAVLDDTSRSLREVCAELRPAVLDYAGLAPAIESYAKQFSKRSGIHVDITAPHDMPRLATEVESSLFRIVQEALTNSLKYAAGANRIDIELLPGSPLNTLSISDNGIGFDVGAVERGEAAAGLGLLSMRRRAEFIDGRLTVESAPDQGTRIRVEFPTIVDNVTARRQAGEANEAK